MAPLATSFPILLPIFARLVDDQVFENVKKKKILVHKNMPTFKLAYSCELIFVFLFSKLGRLNTHIYLHCLELLVQAAPDTTAASLAQT